MRGRKSGHHSVLLPPPGVNGAGEAGDWTVLSDLPENAPVTDAELDAIEAFLMAHVNAIMQDSGLPQITVERDDADSEAPQSPAQTKEKAEMLEVL